MWVRLDIKVPDAYMLKDIEEKEDEVEVVVGSDQHETPMH